MQCGFPLQDKCYKKHPTQGCPGIPGHQVTLSTGGYPCYWQLDNSSCAWCNSAGYQTRNNICVTEINQEKFDAVKGDCDHIPKCDDNASCKWTSNKERHCLCNEEFTGNGIQCADSNGTLALPEGVVLASLEIQLENQFYVFVQGEEVPIGN